MEEMIKFVIFNNLMEVESKGFSVDGLCFYFANNIKADLEMMEIPVFMYNINKGAGHDHYYLVANKEYLIDPTYSQFIEKTGERLIMFEDFPANILNKSERGKVIFNDLINNGYHRLIDDDLDIYLSSFRLKTVKERRK